MCCGALCYVCGLISLSSWLFLWLSICGLVQVLFLSFVVIFNFSIAIYLLLPLGQICSQTHILTSYCFCGAQWLRITHTNRFTRFGTSLLKMETQLVSETSWIFKKLGDRQSPKKNCSVNLYHAVFSLLDFFNLEAGTERLSQNVRAELFYTA